jgi:hypothetical protein
MLSASRAAALSFRVCQRCMSTRSSRIVAPLRPSAHFRIKAYQQPGATFATVARHNVEGKSSADEAVEKIQELYVEYSIARLCAVTNLLHIATRQHETKSAASKPMSLLRVNSNIHTV